MPQANIHFQDQGRDIGFGPAMTFEFEERFDSICPFELLRSRGIEFSATVSDLLPNHGYCREVWLRHAVAHVGSTNATGWTTLEL